MKKEEEYNWEWALAIFIILFVVIFYVASLGNLNTDNLGKIPDEFKDSQEAAKSRHKRLKELIERQKGLKTKLDKKFKRVYFGVRFFSIAIWITLLFILYFFNLIHDLGDALNYSEAMILFLITINFLTFGSVAKFDNFIENIKTKTENWVYRKYITIDEKIKNNEELEQDLQKQLSESNFPINCSNF